MKIQTKLTLKYTISILIVLMVTHVIQKINMGDSYAVSEFIHIAVFLIYMSLLALWGASVDRRITNRVIKNSLLVTDGFMIFWLFFRTMKFYVFSDIYYSNLMWYCYYACLLVIVLCFFIVTDCMVNKDISRRLNNGFIMSFITVVLSLLVLTNEKHKLFFEITGESGEKIKYKSGFFLMAAWVLFTMTVSIVRVSVSFKERELRKKLAGPVAILLLGIAYCTMYGLKIAFAREFEFSIVFFCLIIGMWESFIVSGLIPSNVEYEWCFNHSVVKSQILDNNGNVIYSALTSIPIEKEAFDELKKEGHFYHDKNTEFMMAKIAGGYVAWEKNVRDIRLIMSDMEETEKSISEANESVRKNIEILAKKKKTEEKIKLYDMTFSKVSEDVGKLEGIISDAENFEGDSLRKALVSIDIAGVYLKRKSNLILLNEQKLDDFSEELNLCFKESFDNLSDAGIKASYAFIGIKGINNEIALRIYESLEIGLECCLHRLKEVVGMLTDKGDTYNLMLDMTLSEKAECAEIEASLRDIAYVKNDFEIVEDSLSVSFSIEKGGDGL